MFSLFSAVLALVSLANANNRRNDEPIRNQFVGMFRAMAMRSSLLPVLDRALQGDSVDLRRHFRGLGFPVDDYEEAFDGALQDMGLRRLVKVVRLLIHEETEQAGLRVVQAIPDIRREILDADRFRESMSSLFPTDYQGKRGLSLSQAVLSMISRQPFGELMGTGVQFVDGTLDPEAWARMLYDSRERYALPGDRGGMPQVTAQAIEEGDAVLQGLVFPWDGWSTRMAGPAEMAPKLAWIAATYPVEISGRPHARDQGSNKFWWMTTLGDEPRVADLSLLAQLVLEALSTWSSWPRVVGLSVGSMSNGWEVVKVGPELHNRLSLALPTGIRGGGYRLRPPRSGSHHMRRLASSPRDDATYAIRQPGTGVLGTGLGDMVKEGVLVGVLRVDREWGTPHPLIRNSARVSRSRTPRGHGSVLGSNDGLWEGHTVIEGAPVVPLPLGSGQIWGRLMDEATLLAARDMRLMNWAGLSLSSFSEAHLPRVDVIRLRLKEAGGSVRTLLSPRSYLLEFVRAIDAGQAWARSAGIPPEAVRVRLQGAVGVDAHSIVEWDPVFGLRVERRHRIHSYPDQSYVNRRRSSGPQYDAVVLETTVRVPMWSDWAQATLPEIPWGSDSQRSPTSGFRFHQIGEWKPYFDHLEHGYVVVKAVVMYGPHS